MKLTFLGDGSAFNTIRGNSSAYFIENNELFLIDCGADVFSKTMLNKILEKNKIFQIHIFITHFHDDHIGSLASMIFFWYFSRNKKITVYTGEAEKMKEYLSMVGVNSIMYDLKCKYISKSLFINFVSTDHVDNMKAYGIEIRDQYGKYYFSGDTNNIKNHLKENYLEMYIDTCLKQYPNNLHLNIRDLIEQVPDLHKRRKIFCYHLDDNEELPTIIVENGFNLVL